MDSLQRSFWTFPLFAVAVVLAGAALVSSCGANSKDLYIETDSSGVQQVKCDGSQKYADSGCKNLAQYARLRAGWENASLSRLIFPVPAWFHGQQRSKANDKALSSSPCPAISFAQTSSQLMVGFSDAGTTTYLGLLYRQMDGSFTASGFSIPMPIISNVGTKVGSVTQAQAYFAACQGVASWTPSPHATLLADRPGSMAQGLVVTSLGGSSYASLLLDNSNLAVWLDSQDTFGQTKTEYPLGFSVPWALLAADFNGDGKRDVAVLNLDGNNGKGSVQILLGNGNGTLAAAKSYDLGSAPVAMTAFDFNGDGRADLAVVNEGDNNVGVLLAKADGSLQAAKTYALPGTGNQYAYAVVAADFDGDGRADLMVQNDSGLALLRGNGDGTFQAYVQKTGYTFSYTPVMLAAGDFNKDGKTDLASLNSDGTVTVFLNAGDGSFPTQYRYVAGTPGSVGSNLFVMDFNDDGNLDLVMASGHPDALYPGSEFTTVLFGNGDGTFQNAPPAYAVESAPQSMAMADFNGDGLLDLVVVHANSADILLGKAGGGFQAPTRFTSYGSFVTAADFNGDGLADVLTADISGTGVRISLGNGDGTFKPPITYYGTDPHPSFVAVGDVNGDGLPDLVIADGRPDYYVVNSTPSPYAVPSTVQVMTAKSGGGFNAATKVATGLNTVQVALADVNGDGKLDLIAANLGIADQNSTSTGTPVAGNVTVSLGNGDGTFKAPVAYTVGRNPMSVAVADVNGDGKPDLIVGTITSDPAAKIAVLLGNGDGTFTVPTTLIDTYSWPQSLVLADFDGDGKLDIAVVHAANDAPLTTLRGVGDGTFEAEIPWYAGDTPGIAFAADFTGDGRPDLAVLDQVVEGSGKGYVTLFRNTSPAAACTYGLSASSQAVPAAGGAGSFQVIAGTGCGWTAARSASWISLAYPAWGSNNGTVSFQVAANAGAARTGTVTVGGKTFTVNQAGTGGGGATGPQALSVDPAAGSWASETYTFTFFDSGGWQNIHVADILINSFVDGRNACYVAVVPSASAVYLVDDAGDAGGPYQGITLPGSGTAQNSQCSISGTGSSISGSGNTLTVTLAITFKSAFAGNKVMYLAAGEIGGANSGWQALGTCGIPGSTPTGPAVGGVTPARSSGTGGGTFVFTFTDTNGWQDLGVVNVLINDALNGNGACYLAYSRAYNTLYLVNDAGNGLLPGLTLNGAGTLGNSQCTVTGAGSSASGSGNTLTLTLNTTFSSSFAGNRIIYMAARSNGDALNSGWQAAGSRTVQ